MLFVGFELEELRCVLYSAHIERNVSYPSHIIPPSSVPLPTPDYFLEGWRVESTVDNLDSFTSVTHNGKQIWVHGCSGRLYYPHFNFGTIWEILYKAMTHTDYDFPVRGPRRYEFVRDFIYTNYWEGNLGLFTGYEQIAGRRIGEVYSGLYWGGLSEYLK